jgi:hypothetical protein
MADQLMKEDDKVLVKKCLKKLFTHAHKFEKEGDKNDYRNAISIIETVDFPTVYTYLDGKTKLLTHYVNEYNDILERHLKHLIFSQKVSEMDGYDFAKYLNYLGLVKDVISK